MAALTITLPDNSTKEVEKGTTVYDAIGEIGKGLQKAAVTAMVNDMPVDLSKTIEEDVSLSVFTFDSDLGKETYWHSASHLMAQAIKKLWPDVKFAIGPAIENGFYYDVDMKHSLVPEDLEKIEIEMKKIIEEDLSVSREELSTNDAIDLFNKDNEQYKVELLNEIQDDTVTIYRQGDFYDLCRGPHVNSTGKIKAVKLLSIAGAYWRGDEKNKMLQRIYGIAFPDEKALKKYLNLLEEVKKRDHRKLGKELDLFSVHEDVGSGLIYWHPKGARIRSLLEEWWRSEHFKNGYEILYTPHIGRAHLWETSGHLGFYNENMYAPMEIDGNEYYIKPMNCPFHIKIYETSMHSYRDLPLRWAELGTVYRYEKSGVLHGLLRVRGFTQDDAHIFCTPDQMEDEIREVLRFSMQMWNTLGFSDIKAYLATKPEKSVGEDDRWEQAQKGLLSAIEAENIDIEVDEGGGAFYGPKIDLKVRDAIGREWQMTTIQFDFNLPERFDMYYIGEDGEKHRPYMIHRALLGSIERFFGILTEHYAGKFPLWLAPIQVTLATVNDDQIEYAKEVKKKLHEAGIRVELDTRNESIGYKIRESIKKKTPFVGVIGQSEREDNTISIRKHGDKNSETMGVTDFIALIQRTIEEKA